MINKLMIAIPTLDYMHRKFVESLTNLTSHLNARGINYDVCYEGCTLVYISRDNLVLRAIDKEYDWTMWLDADMVFDENIVDLLSESDKEFVSGVYLGRHGKNAPCVFDSLFPSKRWDIKRISEAEDITQVDGVGFGCALVKTEILNTVLLNYGTCFKPTPQLGEDLAFCNRAMESGYDIWVNKNVKVGHIGQFVIEADGSHKVI